MSRERLAETMVRREYAKKGKNLPDKFWNLPEYRATYQNQMRFASKLYRTYSEEAVWAVINREAWIFSLALKKLANMIEIEENRIKTLASRPAIEDIKVNNDLPQFRINKSKNLLDD